MSNYLKPDFSRRVFVFEYDDDEGEPQSKTLPAKVAVCDRCGGAGKCDPDGFSGGFTPEQLHEDPEFAEEYFAGRYDVSCPSCNGRNVMLLIDEPRCDPEVLKELHFWQDCEAEHAAEMAAERRAGC